MQTGAEALRIFRARGSLDIRDKYSNVHVEGVDKKCEFNPNKDYLLYPTTETTETIDTTSPWHCFTLIPKKTVNGTDALSTTLYMLHFLNWAVYYYKDLKSVYDSIPKVPKLHELSEANTTVKDMTTVISCLTGKEFTQDELHQLTVQAFSKNTFVMKPSYFLKLCRFFARAWYEEFFYGTDDTVMPVKFAHYASCYIEYCYNTDKKFHCSFKTNDENGKKEIAKLFDRKENNQAFNYKYNGFTIELEKYLNPESIPNKKHTYSINISQHGCKHIFYMTARLGQHQYKTSIK